MQGARHQVGVVPAGIAQSRGIAAKEVGRLPAKRPIRQSLLTLRVSGLCRSLIVELRIRHAPPSQVFIRLVGGNGRAALQSSAKRT